MSVGHVARLMEAGGIATVIVASRVFRAQLEKMHLPRVLLTPHVMGRPLGPPGDRKRHHEVLTAALSLLQTASVAGTILALPGSYRS
jgi:hypothetical protein